MDPDHNCSLHNLSLAIPVNVEVDSPFMKILVPILTLLGCIGNVTSFAKIVKDKQFHTHTYFVVAALIFSDLFSLGIYGTYHLLLLLGIIESEILFEMDKLFTTITYGTTHASASHVVFLVGIRFYSVARPIEYDTLSKRKLFKISAVLWVCSICFAFIYYFVRFRSNFGVMPTVLLFRGYLLFIPIIFIIYFHVKKITEIKKNALCRSLLRNDELRRTRRLQARIALMSRMISVILIIFMVSAALYPASFCLIYFGVCCTEYQCRAVLFTARLAWMLKFSLNPLIYLLFSEAFCKRVKWKCVSEN